MILNLCALVVTLAAASCGLDVVSSSSPTQDGSVVGSSGASGSSSSGSSGTSSSGSSGISTNDASTDAGGDLDAATTGDADAGPSNVETLSIISPSTPTGSLTFAKQSDWVIAALGGQATIRYTLDGSIPTASSKSGTGKVTLSNVPGDTIVKWTSGGGSTVNTFTIYVDINKRPDPGYALMSLQFAATGSPIIEVSPNTVIPLSAAFQFWVQNTCPACATQLTYGLTNAVDCFVSSAPGIYPGTSFGVSGLMVTAPSTPGSYPLRIGQTEENSCNLTALAKPLSATAIGLVVVK